ncbi:MAG: Preprotein translocase, YajC subunit [Pseudomonadota bacterium]
MSSLDSSFLLLAQAAAPQGGGTQFLIMTVAMVAIMWFLVIGPQRKQMKQHKEMLGALKKGDDVVTGGGLMGRVHAITDKVITLEVASGVRVQVLKSSVQGKLGGELAPEGADKKEEK